MRSFFTMALALLVALEAPHAPAQMTDVQTGAIVAGGVLAGAGVAAQLATGSKISVKVEVFQDTLPLPAAPAAAVATMRVKGRRPFMPVPPWRRMH
ncbi:MAG: hypothetical protein HC888_13445 [Candidatus Competibacteraceae bacterium]|nr:hypothetical protein [Candidatus Competibacteraceae bacterium]